MRRLIEGYVGALAIVGGTLFGFAELGHKLYPSMSIDGSALNAAARVPQSLATRVQEPLTLLLLQMIVMICAARLVGTLFRRIGQPAVVGEMFAGILMGPSVLGLIWPEGLHFLFPAGALAPLQLLSQLGVLLFMFAVGLDVDLQDLRRQARAALVISHVSIAVPFLMGVGLALGTFNALAPPNVPFFAFALFLGIAMSITAFPVLARILEERGMMQSAIGRLALACAAIGDVTAWCLLVVVIALVQATGALGAAAITVITAIFVFGLHTVIKPALTSAFGENLDRLSASGTVAVALVLMLMCSAVTEAIGIHALFGAFVAGTAMPAGKRFRQPLRERMSGFSAVGLMPLFFALTGLRTRIGSLEGLHDWALFALILVVATLGKLGAALVTARLTGSTWRDSTVLGVLMNTRGLMELIVLNIGYDFGILPDRAFTMLVIMALITTCMTGPMLQVLSKKPSPVLER